MVMNCFGNRNFLAIVKGTTKTIAKQDLNNVLKGGFEFFFHKEFFAHSVTEIVHGIDVELQGKKRVTSKMEYEFIFYFEHGFFFET